MDDDDEQEEEEKKYDNDGKQKETVTRKWPNKNKHGSNSAKNITQDNNVK